MQVPGSNTGGARSTVKATARTVHRGDPKASHRKGRSKATEKKKHSSSSTATTPPPVDPNAPLDVDAPLTGAGLDQNVATATQLQYGGADAELAGQRGVHAQMAANIPTYFQQYQDMLRASTQATGAGYAAAAGIQQNAANTSSALDAQQRAAIQAPLQADAASRGATVDPAIAAQGQQAAASRRAMLDAGTGLTAGLGAAEVGFRANRQVVGAGQKLSAITTEAQRGRNIDTAGMNLAREKGAFMVKARQDMLNTEHTKALENKAFGLDVVKAQDTADAAAQAAKDRKAQRSTTNKNADESRRLEAERLRLQQEKDAYQRKHQLGPYAPPGSHAANTKDAYGNTPAARRGAQDGYDRAKVLAHRYGDAAPDMSASELESFLVTKGISALNAHAAALAVRGGVDPHTAARLKHRGVRVGGVKATAKTGK
jgi:hypothetical protein